MVIEYFMEWVQNAPVRKREAAASAMVRAFLNKNISLEERDDIDAALTVLLEDKSASVRLAMAEAFGAFANAPRHIIAALAQDNKEIAMVVLSCSPVFHDSELLNFIKSGNKNNQIAISCRPWLSGEVVSAVCEHGEKDANLGLLMNPVATLTPDDLHTLATRLGTDAEIRKNLLQRKDLPARSRHLLIGKLGEALGNFLEHKSWLPKPQLDRTLGEACDRASIIFAASAREDEITSVVRNLIASDRLTVAFLVRAICMGNISLVASAFSELSGVRYSKVETILTRNREAAFKAVYHRAGLPESAFIIFKTAIATWRRLIASGSKINQSRLPFIVTREVLEHYASGSDKVVDDLLVLLRRLAAETARENSRAKAEEIATRKQVAEMEATEQVETLEVLEEEAPLEIANSVPANSNEPEQQRIESEIVAKTEEPAANSMEVEVEEIFVSEYYNQEAALFEDETGISNGLLYAPQVRAA